MVAALRHLIGKICHVYLDDIVIWSDSVAVHTKHIDMVMKALTDAKLHLQRFSKLCGIALNDFRCATVPHDAKAEISMTSTRLQVRF